MTKKSRSSRPHSSSIRRWRIPKLWLFQLAIIVFVIGAIYLIWLDHRIHTEFEGKRWSLPARVYARPSELFIGEQLSQTEVVQKLQILNYRKQSSLSGPGQYRVQGNDIEMILRPFHYWDKQEPQRHLHIQFAKGQILRMRDRDNDEDLVVTRLEPQLIGKIYPEHNEDRVLVPYNNEVPTFLIDALVAIEDRNFYRHFGLDFKGIFRAFWVNIRSGRLSQGGSTLTQQLVKNFFLTQDRTLQRKINEMFMALLLERRYSKADILSAYINEIYLGQNGARGIHGFGTAAEFYFAKPLNELSQEQLALLVGLVRGASYYDPRRHPERALKRRNLVLTVMEKQGYIDKESLSTLQTRPLAISKKPKWSQAKYPAFIDLVKQELLQDYELADLQNEGLRIFTTLDPVIQDKAEKKIENTVVKLEQGRQLQKGVLETAMLVSQISNGEILAVIGGRQSEIAGFNRAINANRQIGSLIKPFIYLTALSKPRTYNVLTLLDDIKITLKEKDGNLWQPANYDHKEHGKVTLLEALTRSYNLATVRLGLDLGLAPIVDTLQKAGLQRKVPPYPSILLGSLEFSPYEVSQLYQVLANGGYRVPLKTITDVLDKRGKPLQRYELEVEQVWDSDAAFLTSYLLTKVVESGTAMQLRNIFPESVTLAGKTGTTNDSRDSWFAGYDDKLLTVIWLGRDDNKPTPFTGASGAMQLWAKIMQNTGVHSIELAASDNIMWSEAESVTYRGECKTISTVPYAKGYPLAIDTRCVEKKEPESPFSKIMRWFE